MILSPRTRAFVNELRSIRGDIPQWPDENVTMPRLMEQLVGSIESWSAGWLIDGDDESPWELVLELYPLEPVEALHVGWLIERLLVGMFDWDVVRHGERLSIRVLGEAPAHRRSAAAPYELTIWDGHDQDRSLAVVQAAHYNEFAKLVDALSEIDESAGDAIRRVGGRVKRGEVIGLSVRGYFLELGQSDAH